MLAHKLPVETQWLGKHPLTDLKSVSGHFLEDFYIAL
jgi:hypothetical protein